MFSASQRRGQAVPTFLLVILSILALETARCADMYEPKMWIIISSVATAITTLGFLATRNRNSTYTRGSQWLPYLVALSLLAEPLVSEWIARRWLHQGRPGEMIFLDLIRGLMLALLLLGSSVKLLHLAATLSLFICIGSLAIVANGIAFTIVILYSLIGSWWLMGNHWDSLRVKLPASTRLEIPFTVGLGASSALLALVLCLTLTVTAGLTISALPGWLPTSGGDGKLDPFATKGIGDGDAVVAAKDNAESFGAVESDLFLASHHPSMYDMFDDSYGEPVKKVESKERAVSVNLKVKREENHNVATSQQAGREFSTIRLPPERKHRHLTDQRKNALFFVSGRVPLHLRMESFDTFDGRVWTQSKETIHPPFAIVKERERPWLNVVYPVNMALEKMRATEDSHALKIINLNSPRIPTPVQATGLHIDLVDRAEFYEWTADGNLAMSERDTLPPLQVIHVRSRTSHVHDMPASEMERSIASSETRVAQCARTWTKDVDTGSATIAVICERLKQDFHYDPQYVVPGDTNNSVEEFLFESRRGNDYLFASAAAELLRSLGYRCRLATGFYAQPQDYDAKAGSVVVSQDDLHTWLEVAVRGNRWITVDPSPGYEVLSPPMTLTELGIALFRSAWRLVAKNLPLVSMLFISSGLVAYFWRQIVDRLSYCWWLWEVRLGGTHPLAATRSLLERRAWLAGLQRPQSMPLARWYSQTIAPTAQPGLRACEELADWISLAVYASPQRFKRQIESQQERVQQTCRTVVKVYSLEQLQRAIH